MERACLVWWGCAFEKVGGSTKVLCGIFLNYLGVVLTIGRVWPRGAWGMLCVLLDCLYLVMGGWVV